jgi:hypothetical protein
MLRNPAASRLRGAATIIAGSAVLALLTFGTGTSAAARASAAARNLAPHPTPRQVERFWTGRRMAAARPLEMTIGRDGHADVHLGPRRVAARASYSLVETPEAPPYSWNGRLYVVQGGKEGFCSATAIESASRRLVLTAGHCVNTGPKNGAPGTWSSYLEFIPGYNLGTAPYGAFVLSGRPRALPEWTHEGNPDFDLGAFLTEPNSEGVALDDAVGGGAKIVTDLGHRQRFETFGYPGGTERMRTCISGYAGKDPVTFGLPGPSTVGIHCRWAPGASGGAWLIDGGREIDGMNTYLRVDEKQRTFGPYFSASTVGRLVVGL